MRHFLPKPSEKEGNTNNRKTPNYRVKTQGNKVETTRHIDHPAPGNENERESNFHGKSVVTRTVGKRPNYSKDSNPTTEDYPLHYGSSVTTRIGFRMVPHAPDWIYKIIPCGQVSTGSYPSKAFAGPRS